MTPAQLKEARHTLGFSARMMAHALSDPDGDSRPVNPRTIRRWEDGSQDIPSPVIVAVNFLIEKSSRKPRLPQDRR